MTRFCACDVGGKDKVSFDDAINKVLLRDASRHNMSVRGEEVSVRGEEV